MNAAPWASGPAAPAPPPADVAAVRLDAPAFAPVAGLLEAILRTAAPRRITLLAAGGGRLSLLAADGALLAVEGAEGPPAESGKARAARLAALLGGFCAAAATGGAIRARIEAAEGLEGARVLLPVPPETLAALVPVLPEPEGALPGDGAAAGDPPEAPEGHRADGDAAGPAPAPPAAPPDALPDVLGEGLGAALGDALAVALALPGAGIAWAATRAEAAAGGGRLALRAGSGDEPAVRAAGRAEAAAALEDWMARAPGTAAGAAAGGDGAA